jgi:hypothetical protein
MRGHERKTGAALSIPPPPEKRYLIRLLDVRSHPAPASEPPSEFADLNRQDGASDPDKRGEIPDALLDRKSDPLLLAADRIHA